MLKEQEKQELQAYQAKSVMLDKKRHGYKNPNEMYKKFKKVS